MKNISFFVSSTFNDMQSERDLIREKIAPELSVIAAKYGYNIDFVDLRWGINTKDMSETEANRKILQTCFDEIQKSRPFFVALLGERYGWIPDSEDVMSAYQSSDVQLNEEDLDKSITELEIECALRSFPFMDRTLFYFRDPIDYGADEAAKNAYVSQGKEKKKLQLLKKRITEKYPTQTFSYNAGWDSESQRIEGLDNLEQSLIENIRVVIEKELAKELAPQSPVEESVNVTDSLIDATNVGFAGRIDELATISQFLRDTNERLLVLSGNSGCGKSSLMCKAIEQATADGYCAVPFFTGCHEHALTAEDMVRCAIWRIEKLLALPQSANEISDTKQLLKRFYELINLLAIEHNVVLFVDAINQFAATPMEESLSWLNMFALSSSVKVVLSTTPNYAKLKQIRAMGAKVVNIDYFSDGDVALVTQKFFRSNHRQVNDNLVNAVVNKGQGVCRVPVYLMTLLMELNSIGREDFAAIRRRERELGETAIDAILNYLTDIVVNAPQNQQELLTEFLARAKLKVGDVCDLYVCAIALSRRGLSERHVERICRQLGVSFEAADFAYFRKLFSVHLVQRENGAWDFNHLLVKDSFLNSFPLSLRSEVVSAIVATLTEEENANPFKKSEYAYYLALANRLDEYVSYFVQMQQDATVQKALYVELQNCNNMEVADKLLVPVTENTPVIRSFITQRVARGEFPFAHGERLTERVLNSIYTEADYSTNPTRLAEIYDAYCALGNAAASAGYYALAKDYLLMAVSLADKYNLDKTTLYGKIANCCHRLGQTLSARRYQSLSKRALLAVDNRTADITEQLLATLLEEAERKTEGLFARRSSALPVICKMQQILSAETALPHENTVMWSVKLLKLAANAGVSHTEMSEQLQTCREYAATAEDCQLKADALYAVALVLSKAQPQEAATATDSAYQCVKNVLNASVDSQALLLLAQICELKAYFARFDSEASQQFTNERINSLAQLNAVAPSYGTLHQYLSETSGRSQVRRDAAKLYRSMSRGQKTTEQKSADKIILAIILSMFLVYFVAMPVMFSFLSGVVTGLLNNSRKSAFELFVDEYLDFVYESIFNMLVCFLAYGLLQLFKPKADYILRKLWAIRSAALLAATAIWTLLFYALSIYFSSRVLNTNVFNKDLFAEMAVTACGFVLVMFILNDAMKLVSRERRVYPAQHNYRRFVTEYPLKAAEFGIEMAFIALIGALYWVASTNFAGTDKLTATSTRFYLALPTHYFAVAISVVALLSIARFIRLTVIYFINKKRNVAKEQAL